MGRLSEVGSKVRAGGRLAPALVVLAFAVLQGVIATYAQEQLGKEDGKATAVLLDIHGAIGPATAEYLQKGLQAAAARKVAIVIVRIDTPGGLSSSMRDIIRNMLASPVPVIVYVGPSGARAASAGTYILYASQLAAMAPGTNLGAATPVQLGGGSQPLEGGSDDADGEKDHSANKNDPVEATDAHTAKAVNDAVAYIRSLAELQDRNADWAEEAVRKAASLSAGAALKKHVVELLASDVDDLLQKADGRSVRLGGKTMTLQTRGLDIVAIAPDWRTQLLGVITNPNIAYILLLIGIYGIIFEFFSPGTFLPGVIGAIALVTGLFALDFLPINFAGSALVLLGVALMVGEAFAPSFGALGIGGAAAFTLGSLFMFEEAPGFKLSLSVVLTATAVSLSLLAITLAVVVRAHRRKVVSGDPAGATGEVLIWSGGSGQIRVHGERWQARSATPLAPGTQVYVKSRDKLILTVEPETSPDSQGEPS